MDALCVLELFLLPKTSLFVAFVLDGGGASKPLNLLFESPGGGANKKPPVEELVLFFLSLLMPVPILTLIFSPS